MTQKYNNPHSSPSSIGPQIRIDTWKRKALTEAMREQVFQPLADVTMMPRHSGKTIKQFMYIPLIDDRNVNDEGIDAAGAIIQATHKYVTLPGATLTGFADATAATDAAAAINAIEAGVATAAGTAVTVTKTLLRNATDVQAAAVESAVPGSTSRSQSGNLYGSDRDIGTIPDKMPIVGEEGGRVNRVGFTRVEIEGTFEKYGFFREYTQESLDFDTDDQLQEYVNYEMLRGASKVTEDLLQLDLIQAAGTVKYSGATSTSFATMDADARVTYGDLIRLGIELDKNYTPKKTTVITGSRMIDTKVIPAARYLFIGSELLPDLMQLKNWHNEPAFIPVEKYGAAAGYLANNEAGSIAGFRVIVNYDMMKHAGRGAETDSTTELTHYNTNGKLDIFPMLAVGDQSFTTIGFQASNASSAKFTTYVKKPGIDTVGRDDPYGELGLMSIKWYYGFLATRPERIAIQWTTARL